MTELDLENGLMTIGGYILVWPPRDAVEEIEKIVDRLLGESTSDNAQN